MAQVYEHELLSVRGQIDLVHYEDRLRTVLGNRSYTVALGLLTEAAVNGGLLTHGTVRRYLEMSPSSPDDEGVPIEHVLYSLEHDGYLESQDGGYGFVSGLLEDWWRAPARSILHSNQPVIGREGGPQWQSASRNTTLASSPTMRS